MSAGVIQRIEFPPAVFTRELAAYYLSRSLREIDDLRKTGELIPVGDGKRVFFLKADLDRFAEKLPERDSVVVT